MLPNKPKVQGPKTHHSILKSQPISFETNHSVVMTNVNSGAGTMCYAYEANIARTLL